MNIATAIGASYLATRAATAHLEHVKNKELGIAMTDSFVSGYTGMAMIAGILTAPVPSSIVGAGLLVRDAYVHRAWIVTTYAKATRWLQRPKATVHQLKAVS